MLVSENLRIWDIQYLSISESQILRILISEYLRISESWNVSIWESQILGHQNLRISKNLRFLGNLRISEAHRIWESWRISDSWRSSEPQNLRILENLRFLENLRWSRSGRKGPDWDGPDLAGRVVQIWPEGVLRHRGWEYICLKLRILRHRAWECVCLNLRILRHRAWECVCLNLRQTYSQALCLRILNIHSPPLPGQGQSPQGASPWPGACPVPWPRSVPCKILRSGHGTGQGDCPFWGLALAREWGGVDIWH